MQNLCMMVIFVSTSWSRWDDNQIQNPEMWACMPRLVFLTVIHTHTHLTHLQDTQNIAENLILCDQFFSTRRYCHFLYGASYTDTWTPCSKQNLFVIVFLSWFCFCTQHHFVPSFSSWLKRWISSSYAFCSLCFCSHLQVIRVCLE